MEHLGDATHEFEVLVVQTIRVEVHNVVTKGVNLFEILEEGGSIQRKSHLLPHTGAAR